MGAVRIQKSIYKGVSKLRLGGKFEKWKAEARIEKANCNIGFFETEREAALAVDKKLISIGKQPVNILKKL